jgi:hypothetical protein
MSALIELKRGGGDQFFIWLMAAMFGLVVALFAFVAATLLADGEEAGWMLVVLALFTGGLAFIVYREAAARSFTRIAINWKTLELRLPAARGYVPQEKVDTSIPLVSIKAIESRAESYQQIGTTALQFAYSLVLEDGRRIFLGADRRFLTPYFQNAASVISNNIKQPIRDLGLVDGNPGFLLVVGQSAPPWNAAPVPPATMQKRFRQEASGWRIAWFVTSAALAIGMIARAFGN